MEDRRSEGRAVTEIKIYDGGSLIYSCERECPFEGFDLMCARRIVADFLIENIGMSSSMDVSVVRDWKGRFAIKAKLGDVRAIREIKLKNILR